MSTAATVKEQLLKLISLSNEATGNEDADLTTAVLALISGYVKDENGVPVFVADFSGSAPSPSQFYSWEGRVYDGAIYDALSNIKCVDGVAKLTSVYDPDNNRWIKQMMCTGGIFESDDFICTFRAKFSGIAGSWQNVITYGTGTHWTDGLYSDGVKWPAGGEIDYFEQVGGYSDNPNFLYPATAHWGAGTESALPHTVQHQSGAKTDLTTDEWHDFKFSLKDGIAKAWIDGVLVGENDLSGATISNNYLFDYKPFLRPHAFYIDGQCHQDSDTTQTFVFEVSDFKVYTEKKVECTGLEVYPQMWEKGTDLIFPTGAELYLDRVYTPANVSNKACTWQSSNTNVATVVQGYVKTIAEGNAVITATCGEVSASYNLTVSNSGANIPCVKAIFEQDTYSVNAGDALDLTCYLYPLFTTEEMTIASGDTSVATVSGTTVIGVTPGSTTLTLSCGNQSATVSLTVASAARTPFAEYDLTTISTWEAGTIIPNTGSKGEALDITMTSADAGQSAALSESMNLKTSPLLYFWKIKPSEYGQQWFQNGTSGNVMPSIEIRASDILIRHGSASYYTLAYSVGDEFNIAVYSNGTNTSVFINGEVVKSGGGIGYIPTEFTYYYVRGVKTGAFSHFIAYHNYEFTEDELIAMTQLDS